MAEEGLDSGPQLPCETQCKEDGRGIVTLLHGDDGLPTHAHGGGELSLGQPQ